MSWLAKVFVSLKPTVNDPQGLAIRGGLHQLGFERVESVRMGKFLELRVSADTKEEAAVQVEGMCQKLLANPVIEQYSFELERTLR